MVQVPQACCTLASLTSIPGAEMSDVTQVIARLNNGDEAAAKELLTLVYDELRKLARWYMNDDLAADRTCL